MKRIRIVLVTALMLSAYSAVAQTAGDLHEVIAAEGTRIQSWGRDARLVEAVRERNTKPMDLTAARQIDEEWVAGGQAALKKSILAAPCSDHLRSLARAGVHDEMFVTDAQGLLVCANKTTSDFIQSDEPKFINAFKNGKGAMFVDRPRFDESARTVFAQISVPIMDGDRAIGVLIVGALAKKMAGK